MEDSTTKCPKCQEPLEVGSWPFCKGGHGRGFSNIVPDETDFVTEHGWAQPMRFRSKAEWRRAMKAEGIEHTPRYAPPAGTDKPKHGQMTNWNAYVDLSPDKLAWLADRMASGKAQKEPELPKLHIRPDVRDLSKAEVVELQKHV